MNMTEQETEAFKEMVGLGFSEQDANHSIIANRVLMASKVSLPHGLEVLKANLAYCRTGNPNDLLLPKRT